MWGLDMNQGGGVYRGWYVSIYGEKRDIYIYEEGKAKKKGRENHLREERIGEELSAQEGLKKPLAAEEPFFMAPKATLPSVFERENKSWYLPGEGIVDPNAYKGRGGGKG